MAPTITLCDTPAALTRAAATLAASPTRVLIVDCEGRDLGMPGGALSVLTLSDAHASSVYLIDIPTLARPTAPPTASAALSALLDLFASPSLTKVFWDGRADVLELRASFPSLTLSNVLDLQLLEIAARAPTARETDAERLDEFRRRYFRNLAADVRAQPALFDGIYFLSGLDKAVRTLRLDVDTSKDPSIVAMHKANDTERWMARPLSAALQAYAAQDAVLISAAYARLTSERWLHASPGALARIKAASARYVTMFQTRGRMREYKRLDLARFLPMGFLDDTGGGEHDDGGNVGRLSCPSCGLSLPEACFATRGDGAGYQQRQTFCRLCHAVARKTGRKWGATWVPVY
ncbi:hypothetical protein PYCCODRAFT_1479033 [Trametes coccinea BRFM310]|uniref:3'-5' exonuclease domain-containing protein n=1 Tax=Trametes coccinea (strain BRFM310) TaxID=1353009 RepID=A0A1Y2IHA7_TRAC3|nr:hypothetical protein PYCCODRAFT_1479033 [Trametes coccinea BRFM310]